MVIIIMAVLTSVGDSDFYGVDGDTVVVIYTMLRIGIYMMLLVIYIVVWVMMSVVELHGDCIILGVVMTVMVVMMFVRVIRGVFSHNIE